MCRGIKEPSGKPQRGFWANYGSKLGKSRNSNPPVKKTDKGKHMNHCVLHNFCLSLLIHLWLFLLWLFSFWIFFCFCSWSPAVDSVCCLFLGLIFWIHYQSFGKASTFNTSILMGERAWDSFLGPQEEQKDKSPIPLASKPLEMVCRGGEAFSESTPMEKSFKIPWW